MTTPQFSIGDRVRIVGAHPWSGHAGTIEGPLDIPTAPDLKWKVNLDGGWSDAAVAEGDIRHAAH